MNAAGHRPQIRAEAEQRAGQRQHQRQPIQELLLRYPAGTQAIDLVDVEGHSRQAFIEDARLHVVLRPRRDGLEDDVAKPLIGVGQHHDEGVAGGGGGDDGQGEDGAQQPGDADAARLHDDDLPIPRHPAQAHQQAEQHRHRNRDAEPLRHQQQQELRNRPAVHALGDQLLGVVHDRRDQQQEGEDQQAQEDQRQGLAQDVAVDDANHHARLYQAGRPRRRGSLRSAVEEPRSTLHSRGFSSLKTLEACRRCRPADGCLTRWPSACDLRVPP